MANTYFDDRDIPAHSSDDGLTTYVFTPEQKRLVFGALSHYGNILNTMPDTLKQSGLTPRQIRKLRAIREAF